MPAIGILAQSTTTAPSTEVVNVPKSVSDLQQACGQDPSWACRWVRDWTGSDSWAGVADWLLAKPVAIVVILVVAWIVARLLRAVVSRIVKRVSGPAQSERMRRLRARAPAAFLDDDAETARAGARADTLAAVARSLVTGFVWFTALVAILDVVDINLGPLLAGAGIVGVALGFGAQTMVKDYLNGFFLVVEDQYGVGDWVDLGPDAKGVVERVTLRATRLRATDGTVWHVPNGVVDRVGNYTQDFAYAVLDVQVALGVVIDEVERLVERVAEELADDPAWTSDVTGRPDLWGVNVLSREGATVRLLLRTAPGAQWRVQRELRRRVKHAFDQQGLTSSLAGQPAPLTFDGPSGGDQLVAAGGGDSGGGTGTGAGRPPRRPAGEDRVAADAMEVAARLESEEERP